MARQDDTLVEQAAKRLEDDLAANAIRTVSRRLLELKAANVALLDIATHYRAQHDRIRWPQNRPCDCEICQEAEKIINIEKGT